MRPVAFGEALPTGTRLTLFSDDKPDRFFIVIKFWMDETSGIALALKTGVPSHQVEDEEGRIHLLLHPPIDGEHKDRWCLWRPVRNGFDLSLLKHVSPLSGIMSCFYGQYILDRGLVPQPRRAKRVVLSV